MNDDGEWMVDENEIKDDMDEILEGMERKTHPVRSAVLVFIGSLLLAMVLLVLVAYGGIRIPVLNALWTPAPDDRVKVALGSIFGPLFLFIGIRTLRSAPA